MNPGDVVNDRFTIERVLGKGASATTYLALDAQAQRRVALKALKARSLEEWKQYELFEREARVLAGLRHHGVPELFTFFEREGDEGLERFLALEWVEGASLATRIKDGPRLDQPELMQLASDILDVLVYLHGRMPPVFHRDIKPSNIIVRADGTPVLIDFGGVCDGWRTPGQSGDTIVGTTGYMPSEQYMGQVGPWSDLYALGATLFHAVTGKPPAEHDFGAGRLELPPDIALSPRLRRFIDAVLAPAPRDRPQSALEARRLLMADDHAAAPSPAAAPTARVAKPLFDPGPAPRDPFGPHAELYKTMRGKFGYGWGCLMHIAMLALTIGLVIGYETFAMVIVGALVWWGTSSIVSSLEARRDAALPPDGTPGARLFIHGSYAIAEVTKREEREKGFTLHYRFRPSGSTQAVEGSFGTDTVLGLAAPPGSRFGVLYDPTLPTHHHCFGHDLA